jgi:hypothetical protein
MNERVAVDKSFLHILESSIEEAKRTGIFEQDPYQNALRLIDGALSATVAHMKDDENGRPPATTRKELTDMWLAVSRGVAGIDNKLALACEYKALGWLDEDKWAEAESRELQIDIDSIQRKRGELLGRVAAPPSKRAGLLGLLTSKDTLEILKVYWPVVAAVVAGLWAAFVYFDGKTWMSGLFDKETTFYLCVGQHESECRAKAGAAFQGCGTDPVAWAKRTHSSQCVSATANKISDVSGNQCGYATFEIKCHSR